MLPHIFAPKPKEIIYHYTSVSAAKSIIESGEIWLSDFEKTNDSTEFKYARDAFVDCIGSITGSNIFAAKILVLNALRSINRHTKMMIGSFTTESDDLNQWITYGDGGSGCVLGFDAGFIEQNCGVAMRRVCYGAAAVKQFAEISLAMLQNEFLVPIHGLGQHKLDEIRLLSQFVAADLFAFKHHAFRAEKEIRVSRIVLRGLRDNEYQDSIGHTAKGHELKSIPIKNRNGKYGETSYLELPTKDVRESALVSIGFGPSTTVGSRETIAEALKKSLSQVSTWQSSIPYR
ncbi:MAG: DUF2971 domain-containing protein [Rhizobiales bacterium]|nr:DUF2971 domain-containing protein [Hyphomicrobiales bacterium]